jgi:TPR repeat protein
MKRLKLILLLGLVFAITACGKAETSSTATAEEGRAAFEERDFDEAFELLLPLAENGDPEAQFKVGFMYVHGRGVDRDFDEAIRWMTAAAEQGFPEAQYNLALSYDIGRGVARDLVEAHKWATLALGQGYTSAGELKEDTASNMTEDELREARKRVSEWRVRQ